MINGPLELKSDNLAYSPFSIFIRLSTIFFAYTLSEKDCSLLDKLPFSLIFMFTNVGNVIVEIVVKNLVMSSAQIVVHEREKNFKNKSNSEKISERCKNILRVLETKLVIKNINHIISNLDNLGNSFDKSIKYDEEQKEFIKRQIFDIAQ